MESFIGENFSSRQRTLMERIVRETLIIVSPSSLLLRFINQNKISGLIKKDIYLTSLLNKLLFQDPWHLPSNESNHSFFSLNFRQ